MGVVLRSFEMPKSVVFDENLGTETYGKFVAEPFERGFGVTVGNSLRRILLSSLEGAAVSAIKIEGVDHEFATIQGVVEDMSEIILNIKQIIVRSHSKSIKTVTIDVDKKGDVTAADIIHDDTIEILNKDHKIATLTKDVKFKAELEISKGRGYVLAEGNKREDQAIGVIPIDSSYSPIKRVAYKVEDTRVGQITDYDKLTIEIWTNGCVSPKDALLYGANILKQQIDVFSNLGELPEEEEIEEASEIQDEDAFYKKLAQPVSELELSVRSANCLSEANIKTIAELVTKSEGEMLKYRNFGRKSLTEIHEILKSMKLDFGMKTDPERIKKILESEI